MNQIACAPAPFFGDNLAAALIGDLESRGWAFAPDALPADLVADLRAEARALAREGRMRAGRVGRGERETRAADVRRAAIRWLDGSTPAQQRFLEGCEALRVAINRTLYAGLFEFEAHYAVYPPGGFYARHLDAFAGPPNGAGAAAAAGRIGARSRVVSLVAYLNDAWTEADGGRLAVWEAAPPGPDGRPDLAALDAVPPVAELDPRGGSLVLMLSERIPHEVRPAAAERAAIAGWWRVNASVGGAVDPPR